ncbi:MAG: hypothetical protein MRY64_01190 [Hyphomonadaceae bacterium]|nr:hypothetical protein [Hyphomonadaceae bacterium]
MPLPPRVEKHVRSKGPISTRSYVDEIDVWIEKRINEKFGDRLEICHLRTAAVDCFLLHDGEQSYIVNDKEFFSRLFCFHYLYNCGEDIFDHVYRWWLSETLSLEALSNGAYLLSFVYSKKGLDNIPGGCPYDQEKISQHLRSSVARERLERTWTSVNICRLYMYFHEEAHFIFASDESLRQKYKNKATESVHFVRDYIQQSEFTPEVHEEVACDIYASQTLFVEFHQNQSFLAPQFALGILHKFQSIRLWLKSLLRSEIGLGELTLPPPIIGSFKLRSQLQLKSLQDYLLGQALEFGYEKWGGIPFIPALGATIDETFDFQREVRRISSRFEENLNAVTGPTLIKDLFDREFHPEYSYETTRRHLLEFYDFDDIFRLPGEVLTEDGRSFINLIAEIQSFGRAYNPSTREQGANEIDLSRGSIVFPHNGHDLAWAEVNQSFDRRQK